MMSGRSKRCSVVVFCGIALICLCVVMYVLGSTMTLWTMQFAFDQTDNPVLEAFALPTMPATSFLRCRSRPAATDPLVPRAKSTNTVFFVRPIRPPD